MKFQLIACLESLQPQDYHCISCDLYFNARPEHDQVRMDRSVTMRVHYEDNCPVLNQVALLLLPLPQRSDGAGSSRCGTSGILPAAGPPSGGSSTLPTGRRRRTSQQASQADQGRAGAKQPRRAQRQPESHQRPDQAHGTSSHQSRPPAATVEPAGLLRHFHPINAARSHPNVDTMGSRLEEAASTDVQGSGSTEPENILATPADERASNPDSPAESVSGWRRVMGSGAAARGPDAGRHLAISEMVQREPVLGSVASSSNANGPDDQADGLSGRFVERQFAGSPLSLPATSGARSTMETPTMSPTRRCLESLGGTSTIDNVEFAGLVDQGPQLGPGSPCANHPADPADPGTGIQGHEQGPLQGQEEREACQAVDLSTRHRLREAILALALDNPGTACYANAAVVSFLWSFLSRHTFEHTDWGIFASQFAAMLFHVDDSPLQLEDQEWFQQVVATWDNRHGQADSAEFLQRLMQRVTATCFSNRWERRLLQGQKVCVHDSSDDYTPITVQLDPGMISSDGIHLNDLLRQWHGELGMQTGLLAPKDLCCCHIDRLVRSPTGQLDKCLAPLQLDGHIMMPRFTQDTTCTWETYQVVAAVSHLGHTGGGHYQTVLRIDSATVPNAGYDWMHCDDNRHPCGCNTWPAGFSNGITVIWLCHTSVLEIHACPASVASGMDQTEAATLAMLNTLPLK